MVSSAVVSTATVIGVMVSIAMASDVMVSGCHCEWVVW